MYWGAKSRIAAFLIAILLFSFFVGAKDISEFQKEEVKPPIEDPEIPITIEESINIEEAIPYFPLDLSIADIYFEEELEIGKELDLIVDVRSTSEKEVEAKVSISIRKAEFVESSKKMSNIEEEFILVQEKEVSFKGQSEVVFDSIVFEEEGDYLIKADIKSSIKERDKKNNKITGSFFFPFLACEDGTYIGECNAELFYCEEGGLLVEKCSLCGCEEGFLCSEEEICIEEIEEREVIRGGSTHFFYGPNGLVASHNGGVKYYHQDNLGSARVLTDNDGGVVAERDYLPFGEVVRKVGKTDGFEYTGKEDDKSGLKYYGARYYDEDAGRFISSDPVKAGLNHYAYVSNNPITKIVKKPTKMPQVVVPKFLKTSENSLNKNPIIPFIIPPFI